MVLAISELALVLVVAGATAVGAAIGGAITGLVTLKAEDKRQAFSRELEERRLREKAGDRIAEMRVAVRLVLEELQRVASLMNAELNLDEAGVVHMSLLRTAWDEHREVLARSVSSDAWTAVARAYGGLEIFRPVLEDGTIRHASLRDLVEAVEAAVDALLPYAATTSFPIDRGVAPPAAAQDEEEEGPQAQPGQQRTQRT
jgi:hypothetical protein